MTDSNLSRFLPPLCDLSLRIMRSRSVPLTAVIELLDQLHHSTSQRDSLREWIVSIPQDDQVLSRSLSTAALISWLFHHQPLPLLIWQEVTAAALFMDLGLIATSLPDRRRRSAIGANIPDAAPINQSHADVGAALISSVTGLPGSVRQMIRHHHERLDGTGYPRRMTANDLYPADRLLALTARTIAGLSEPTGTFDGATEIERDVPPLLKAAADQLVQETLAGAWDRVFVEPVLNALSCLAAPALSFADHAAALRYRVDENSHAVRSPHIRPRVNDDGRRDAASPDARKRHQPPMQLGGPHFRLSEQPFVRRPHVAERRTHQTQDQPTR
ncbi:MAG: HD domain-containing phosphohydrolase [Planctomycetaceae bacterium]